MRGKHDIASRPGSKSSYPSFTISRIERIRDFAIACIVCAILAVGIDSVCFLVLGKTSVGSWYDKYWIGFFFCCAFIIAAFYILRDKLTDAPEYLYLVIVLVVGLFMAWSLSVSIVGWDTGIHYKAVLDFADLDNEFDVSYSEMAFITTNLQAIAGDISSDLKGLYHLEWCLNYNDNGVFGIIAEPSAWNILNGINYIPCAIVMFFCELLGLPFVIKHFLAVVPCVLIYAFVTFFGMRKLKSGKMLYAVIALFPTAVFLAANYGYQYWCTSFFLYGFASLASFLQQKRPVPFWEIAKMLLAFVLACLSKVAYAPLILLALLVPRACFSSKKACYAYRISILCVTFLVALVFLIPILSSGLGKGDTRGGGQIDPTGQLLFILSNPVDYLARLFVFMAPPFCIADDNIVSGYLSLSGMQGFMCSYGYLNPVPNVFFYIVLGLLLITTLTDKNRDIAYGYAPAVACIIVSVVNIMLIVTYMYMIFNNVGELAFRGIQSRYLLPFVFPTLVFLGSHKWGVNGSRVPSSVYNAIVLAIMAFVLMGSWWACYIVNLY